ncbi:MAG: hypothetical protein NTZ14_06770 [Hyphomicrobiales bacterium]|nr:hypothetical protein [Hyphomicrobiales bacterium]
MVLKTKPSPLPSPLDYIPPTSTEVKVKSTDSWWTLAELPAVKAAKLNANDLCYYNFKTRKPTEINWYMEQKLKCTKVTHDGKNYMFSTSDSPGIVYVPRMGVAPDKSEFPPKQEQNLNIWIGIGAKGGTQMFVMGIEIIEGFLVTVNSDMSLQYAAIHGEGNRIGPGVGASGGVCVFLATGVSEPIMFRGLQTGPSSWRDWDFNLALGAQAGSLIKSAKLAKFKPIIDALKKLDALSPSKLRSVVKTLGPTGIADIYKVLLGAKATFDISEGAPPSMLIFDIPGAGGGTEVSVYYSINTFTLLDTGRL